MVISGSLAPGLARPLEKGPHHHDRIDEISIRNLDSNPRTRGHRDLRHRNCYSGLGEQLHAQP